MLSRMVRYLFEGNRVKSLYPKIGNRMNAIEVSHLRRVFKSNIGVIKRTVKEIVAVDDVSFEIQEGELFGLLGPNGAGKTTTTKMLATLLIPTEGTASV